MTNDREEDVTPFHQRDDDFVSLYANNVQFEPTIWDLKMVFGQFSRTTASSKPGIEQHTAITIPWLQAKLLAYYLQLNVEIYEIDNGKIAIPDGMVPPLPTPPQGEYSNNEQSLKAYQHMLESQKRFTEAL